METNTVNGPAGKAGKADVRDEREQRKGDEGRRTSADLAALWTDTRLEWATTAKRKGALCNLTLQQSVRVGEIEEALTADEAEQRKWAEAVRKRYRALVVGPDSFAARLEAFKGVNIRLEGGRPVDGVALASALRNERADILGAKFGAM